MTDRTAQATDVLQHLIRNACVNDGASGSEARNVEVLADVLDAPGLDLEVYEAAPGRANLVARIEGSDPDAPSLLLSGHTDVVPADPMGWDRDPFGGELVDGFVWGRGAIDMLNLTASMAVAVRALADGGFRPAGTLIFAGVADEEAGCALGSEWLVEHHADAVRADYVVTEFGGSRVGDDGLGVLVGVAEKGPFWITIDVDGTPGHGSRPYRTDNALVTAARIVQRLADYASPATVTDAWRQSVEGLALPAEITAGLLDPARVDGTIAALAVEDEELARTVHACTHSTFAPTMLSSGVKTNVIPDRARIQVDIRALPGHGPDQLLAFIDEALGDLRGRIDVTVEAMHDPSSSPADSPLRDTLERVTQRLVPGARTVPSILAGFTDAFAYRSLGAVAYGYGLFSDRMPMDEVGQMFHGRNERIDVDSLGLDVELWRQVATDLLT
ncbi:MAG TPA: M20/M25/M40 family metallo-hydrolase [Nitriliruptorales bacterium]